MSGLSGEWTLPWAPAGGCEQVRAVAEAERQAVVEAAEALRRAGCRCPAVAPSPATQH